MKNPFEKTYLVDENFTVIEKFHVAKGIYDGEIIVELKEFKYKAESYQEAESVIRLLKKGVVIINRI